MAIKKIVSNKIFFYLGGINDNKRKKALLIEQGL